MPRARLVALCSLIAACSNSTTVAKEPRASVTTTTETTLAPAQELPSELPGCIAAWPLRERIALLVWPAAFTDDWAAAERAVRDLHVGGVVLMEPDDAFAADLATHLSALDQLSAHGVLIATDEEGGDVQRLHALELLPSQSTMSTLTGSQRAVILDRHAALVAAVGIDVVLGPVVDVRPVTGDDPLGAGRLFRGGPDEVAALAAEYVAAWQRAGILPVLKHFPGHGSATDDTHDELAVTPPLEWVRDYDFVPYRSLAASGAGVMVGHLDVPGLTDGGPASMSFAAIALLRELGYDDTLIISDALDMDAIGVDVPTAAVRSLQAGVDVVLFTSRNAAEAVIDAVETAVNEGRLTEAEINDSALRVARLLESPCS